MHELTGKISNVSVDYFTGKHMVTFTVDGSASEMLNELRECENLTIKVDKQRQKRSLDANAYCWVLIGKIAEKTNIPKNEVYQNAVREMGGNYEIVCVQNKAVESICEKWQQNGIGWVTDTAPSKIKGCRNVFLYYGSSVFSVDEMQRLISIIQEDCRNLNIEVKPQEEINSLLREWGK